MVLIYILAKKPNMLLNKYFFFFLLVTCFSFSQISICSWNIMNLGKSKSDSELLVIANAIKSYDIIAIQEVVAGYGGAKAVSRLVAILNDKGSKWDYIISNPTTSTNPSSRERYAFIWKPSIVKKTGNCWLDQNYQKEMDREPFMGTFMYKGKSITLVSFHAVPKKKNPASEIKYFKYFPNLYPKLNLVFMGDFNCPQSHSVFSPIKKIGFTCVFQNQKTSLRQKCINNDCLASEYDNIFYKPSNLKVIKSGIVPFYTSFKSVKEARKISDHIPIWCLIQLK
jgi:deoxyribonuclease-1-like protein